jgi:hypothetical protein
VRSEARLQTSFALVKGPKRACFASRGSAVRVRSSPLPQVGVANDAGPGAQDGRSKGHLDAVP